MRSLRYGVDCYVLGDGGDGGGSWQSLGPPLTAPPREDASEEGCDSFEGDPDRGQRAVVDDDGGGVDQDCGSDNLEGFLCVARGIDRVLSCCDGRSLFLPAPIAPSCSDDNLPCRPVLRFRQLWVSMVVSQNDGDDGCAHLGFLSCV